MLVSPYWDNAGREGERKGPSARITIGTSISTGGYQTKDAGPICYGREDPHCAWGIKGEASIADFSCLEGSIQMCTTSGGGATSTELQSTCAMKQPQWCSLVHREGAIAKREQQKKGKRELRKIQNLRPRQMRSSTTKFLTLPKSIF